ncbi:MAG: 3-deoxy-D-manno-octulosonic acid transferase [Waddliaceae bacterium]
MILTIFYEFFLHIYALFYRIFRPKRPKLKIPKIGSKRRPVIWVHSVSMGETVAIAPLIQSLHLEYPESTILCSTQTETGLQTSREKMPFADSHFYLPLDLCWVIRPIVKQVSPDLVIITETDFWLNFLKICKSVGAKIILVNGKISQRSFERYRKFPQFCAKVYSLFDYLLVQNDEYKKRFCFLGAHLKRIESTGNIKLDREISPLKDLSTYRKRLGIDDSDQVIVFGSTHEMEEEMAIDQFESLSKTIPNLICIIIPRHPNRFNSVAELISQRGHKFNRFSSQTLEPKAKIVLIDTIGELTNCYQIAKVAVVCGSFIKGVGGHNILEPLHFGVPVIFGPYTYSQNSLVQLVKTYQAGVQTDSDHLEKALRSFFEEEYSEMGMRGKQLITEQKGATSRCLERIKEHIDNPI